ncbi:MAG TPA: oligosaccharide flippase family protein [Mucilaginibacter sp.]
MIKNLSANALQLVLNQLFGLIIFYVLSASLDKNSFGQINLALAVLLAAFNILSLGIDQLIIKRIASGEHVQKTLSLYIIHVLISGTFFYGLLLLAKIVFPQTGYTYHIILLIAIGKLMIYLSLPFKQVASGMERFKLLAYMSVISNFIRCICLLVFALLHSIAVHTIIIIFIVGDVAELLVCIYLYKRCIETNLIIQWDKINYIKLLRETIPQSGVVVITSALARFDWIFIGFVLSAVKLAEYSFAYKVFELSTLPLLAIAPLLIPYFTKLFKQQDKQLPNLKSLIRIEIVIAVLTALLLNICWSPIIDWATSGKYGAVNAKTIFILSLCMPLLYVNNFLWTIYFAQGRLKMILSSFIITLIANVAGDLLLIPYYKNEGAAFAFLLACLAQTLFYLKMNQIAELKTIWQSLIICTGCALCSGLIVKFLFSNNCLTLLFSCLIYIALLLLTNQIRSTDRLFFRELSNS